jgi:serine/threonine-protein kinase
LTANPLSSFYPAVGDVIDGKYRIVKYLGEGGMGAVAKAEHMLRRVPVALKFMAPHVMSMEGGVDRFLNEAVLASQIPNDNVVGIFDVGKLPSGAPYLVMEHLEGCDLSDVLDDEDHKGLAPERAVHFLLQILRALQAAHAMGIVHRDLKPANCFVVEKDGEKDFVKLLDFGISKAPVSAGLTHTNTALGTPLYMSPEQARNPKDVDARADLYSAGVILYELLAGRTPHVSESGEATELILKLFTQEPAQLSSLRPDLPEELCAAVHKALSRERDERFADARAMAEAIAPFADARSDATLQKLRTFVPGPASLHPGPNPEHAPGEVFSKLVGGPQSQLPAQSQAPPPFDPRSNEALAATQSTRDLSPAASTSVSAFPTRKAVPEASGQRPALTLLVVGLVAVVGVASFAAWKIAFAPATQATPVPPASVSVLVVTVPGPSSQPPPPTSATTSVTARPLPPPPVSAPSASTSHAPPPATTPDLGTLRPHN